MRKSVLCKLFIADLVKKKSDSEKCHQHYQKTDELKEKKSDDKKSTSRYFYAHHDEKKISYFAISPIWALKSPHNPRTRQHRHWAGVDMFSVVKLTWHTASCPASIISEKRTMCRYQAKITWSSVVSLWHMLPHKQEHRPKHFHSTSGFNTIGNDGRCDNNSRT